jgi:hypothetical protein
MIVITAGAKSCRRAPGIPFLTGIVNTLWGSILKSESVAGIVPDIRISFP